MGHVFELVGGSGDEPVVVTEGAPRLVGRLATCDVPIYDGSISRDHATVAAGANGLEVKDLGSTNGTFVNGQRITETVARDGDTITFGAVSLRVRRVPDRSGGAAAEAPAPLESKILRRMPVRSGTPSNISAVISGTGSGRSGELGSSGSLLGLVQGALPDDRQARRLEVLLEISKELARQHDLDALLRRVAELIFTIAPVDRVCIMTVEGETLELVPRIARGRRGAPVSPKTVPRALAYQAVADRVALLSEDLAKDERFDSESAMLQRQRSAVCIPLAGDGTEVLGILYADKISPGDPLGEADLDFLIAVGNLAAVAIENRQLQERGRRESEALDKLRRILSPNDAQEIAGRAEVGLLAAAKRPIVVLVSELCGFTAGLERMSAGECAEVVNAYCGKVVETVFQYGGTLDHVIGHTVIAMWGSPIARPDDGDRALRAAHQIRESVEALNAMWSKRARSRVEIGVGIAFGEVFVGSIGTKQRSEYTVIGRALEQAMAFARAARPGEILVGESFLAKVTAARSERAKLDLPDGKVFRILD